MEQTNDKPLLHIQDLHLHFYAQKGQVQAVRGVDLKIPKGKGVALVGESGCGKSATSHVIMRLIASSQGKVTRGKVLFCGEDLLCKSEKQMQRIRGRHIGMIFQNPMTALNPVMRVGKQITEVMAKHLKLSKQEAKKKAIEVLHLVGIPQAAQRFFYYPFQLSGGMRQRVMIAIALVCYPELLIADEPTTALDVTIQAQILKLIAKLKKQFSMSLLLITHDLASIAEVCETVAVMYAGKIVEVGDTQKVLKYPQHPYTKGLIQSLPGSQKGGLLKTIEGAPPDLYAPLKGCSFAPRCPYAMKVCQKQQPQPTYFTEEAKASCFLHHPYAEAYKNTFLKE